MPNFRAVGSVPDHIADHSAPPGAGCTETAFDERSEGCRTSFPVCGALCRRFPGVSCGASLRSPQDFRGVWTLSRSGDRRDCRAPGEVCRAPDVRKLPLGYCRYQNQRRACSRELRGLPRCALSESACAGATQGEPLRAFRGPDRSPASPHSAFRSPCRRPGDGDAGEAGHIGAVRALPHGQRG